MYRGEKQIAPPSRHFHALRTCSDPSQLSTNWRAKNRSVRDLSEISRGEGVETEGGSQLFETAEKGGVMKNGPLKGRVMQICVRDRVEVYPQKKKEVLYFVKKTGRNRRVK